MVTGCPFSAASTLAIVVLSAPNAAIMSKIELICAWVKAKTGEATREKAITVAVIPINNFFVFMFFVNFNYYCFLFLDRHRPSLASFGY